MKWTISIGIATISMAAVVLGTSGAAYAAAPGGAENCPSGSICLYYNSPQNGWGSFEHWPPGHYGNLGNYQFKNWGNGSGYGVTVGGNAASIVNNTDQDWIICSDTALNDCQKFHPGFAGALPDFLHNADWAMESTG
ncbi:peptidase inhibitor family I36 protein [Streptomyces sp. NPDC101234]|uniref:peptidase inhibitor family I36 protein n=1 Tax=Streptomyces sp. NPDC101234 TaxID=3366138 RepID=UPI0037FD9A30